MGALGAAYRFNIVRFSTGTEMFQSGLVEATRPHPVRADLAPQARAPISVGEDRIRGQVDPVFVEPLKELPELLQGLLQDGDIVLTVGAGNIGSIAAELPRQLCQEVE